MIRRRKNVQKRLLLIILFLIDSILYVSSQALYGTTGLLHAPTAEMQKDKTFMAGGNVLHLVPLQYISSNEIKYTFNYYLNITIFPCLFASRQWGHEEVPLYRIVPVLDSVTN